MRDRWGGKVKREEEKRERENEGKRKMRRERGKWEIGKMEEGRGNIQEKKRYLALWPHRSLDSLPPPVSSETRHPRSSLHPLVPRPARTTLHT